MGCPIRKSRYQRSFAPKPGLSQLITSFIASESQGIHRSPFFAFLFALKYTSSFCSTRSFDNSKLTSVKLFYFLFSRNVKNSTLFLYNMSMNGVLFLRTGVKGTDSNRFMWTAFFPDVRGRRVGDCRRGRDLKASGLRAVAVFRHGL